ncbi:G protein-coupled receptor, rhodopsin-like family and GPCR, rhodopsin-like, 7TM domain and 7TM GPCR, serpentine receptor class x (Srx) family-containing protein [Strongyloides ratti]|uniref:G protein-coupled receptor, rhodopsin-like family and GPCR, rhodopsin-like, 7TM domain and 7TM GPCR, serpentine receptor class x (Srx) family-containing protein n=1 Tax=Strongyloides ratti TaxID=34506 RepID=A0A090MWH5_STRRB|nr:G protein-coupled receptor, rhodopsin-like family and GPCR, rhodopsin-like, 7TM domain and 7TM GPCR, serpentine receptor class x (Srx) family-containing protein [Strongyloides ratti]CEF63744.1 G protein-coupled receptor, rhodopsin-like family and GPCR, rhodopsin-like, 7TM domain and 7TM GPCR, serpentine receptor class x (Srx) family-containing protein [Strongyloides ratti]
MNEVTLLQTIESNSTSTNYINHSKNIFLNGQSNSDIQYKISIDGWGLLFGIICDVLGIIGLFLNFFVVYALLANQKRMLSNIFYVLVLHCSIVDIVRGICLIINGLPNLLTSLGLTMTGRQGLLNKTQYATLILRSCNLLTIFNLLIFTTNEFIVIKFPLHYRRYFSRRTVIFLIGLGWIISILFGVGYVILNTVFERKSIMIKTEINDWDKYLKNYTRNIEKENDFVDDIDDENIIFHNDDGKWYFDEYNENFKNLSDVMDGNENDKHNEINWNKWLEIESNNSTIVKRIESSGINPATMSSLIIFILCYICLFIVLICYGIILKRIRRFHSSSSFKSNNSNLQESKKIINKVQLNKIVSQTSLVHVNSPLNRSSVIGKNISSPLKVSIRRGNSYKRWKSHIMSRHKYLIVIGSVLFVDILFLIPYSTIQMISILYITNKLSTSALSSTFRWGLQLMIGIHSVCQPMCYFRMNEFRQMACLKRKVINLNKTSSKNEIVRVKSFSTVGGKTFNYTKSNCNNEEAIQKMLKEQNNKLQNDLNVNTNDDNILNNELEKVSFNLIPKNINPLSRKRKCNVELKKQLSFDRVNYSNIHHKRLSLFSKLVDDDEIAVVGVPLIHQKNVKSMDLQKCKELSRNNVSRKNFYG